jgi:hypothetical protein
MTLSITTLSIKLSLCLVSWSLFNVCIYLNLSLRMQCQIFVKPNLALTGAGTIKLFTLVASVHHLRPHGAFRKVRKRKIIIQHSFGLNLGAHACLPLALYLQPGLGSTQVEIPSCFTFCKGRLLTLPTKIRLGWQVPRTHKIEHPE